MKKQRVISFTLAALLVLSGCDQSLQPPSSAVEDSDKVQTVVVGEKQPEPDIATTSERKRHTTVQNHQNNTPAPQPESFQHLHYCIRAGLVGRPATRPGAAEP